MPKKINFKYTHNGSIIEFYIITIPKRGWFKEHAQPAIDFIKGTVPATARSYDAATYKWEVAVEWWPILTKALKEAMWWSLYEQKDNSIPNIEVPKNYADSFYKGAEPLTTKPSIESIASELGKFLGVEITTQELTELKKLYRKRAMELHPDRNLGRDVGMGELNRLWTLFNTTERSVN